MSKAIVTLVTVLALAGVAYGVYQWALDGNGPSAKELIREQLLTFIDETEVRVNEAKNKVDDFNVYVQNLKRLAGKTLRHAQALAEKEAHANQSVDVVESELKFISGKIVTGEPIQYAGGPVLSPEEIELRVVARGEELAAAKECLQVISEDRQYFERLHDDQIEKLRLAPTHQQILHVRLKTLEGKLEMYRERQQRLDDVGANTNTYTALLSEAKEAISTAEDAVTDAVNTVDSGFKPLLRKSSDEEIASSEASSERSLARINALLATD